MKRITTILSLVVMMLVSSITYADDINIFLRNKWDNELEGGGDDTKTQVLFLADRMVGAGAGSCIPEEKDLTERCPDGGDCYTISVTVTNPANGKVYQADETTDITSGGSWQSFQGRPGLFKVVPNENYIASYSNVEGSCGGDVYPNYYMTDHATKTDCTVEVTFVYDDSAQMCDERPTAQSECTTLLGEWRDDQCFFDNVTDDAVPTNKADCEAKGGLFTGTDQYLNEIEFSNNVVTPDFTGTTVHSTVTKGACILPQAAGSGGGAVIDTLYFCDPPTFSSCTATAAEAGIDYRSVIAEVMRERPDIKYGLYALNGSGATKVFPVDIRAKDGNGGIEDVITNKLKNDTLFLDVDDDEMTTMSALSNVYDYLKSGDDGDVSPLLNECAHTQLIILASGGHSGDDDKYAELVANFTLKSDALTYRADIDTASYAGLLKGIAEYLNNDEGLDPVVPADQHNIKENCTARVTTNVIGVNPVADSKLFTTSLGQEMATLGGGIYKNIDLTENTDEGKEKLGTELFNAILSVVDHSRQDETALITPVAPVSITRGYHVDALYAPAFKAQAGVNWPGNISIGTSSSIPIPSFTDANTVFTFSAARDIYTLDANGDVIDLVKDGDLETHFNQADVDWLKKLGKTTTPDQFTQSERRELLGDILHFRPLPIHIGDQTGGGNTDNVVDNNELFVVVGTNRGLLHVFNKAGEEQWAFLPPQLKPMVKALRQKNIAPTYNMVNHFYGVDGAPSVFIYDAGKDGKINPDEIDLIEENGDDKIILYFGLRRGGAGYFALDITKPADKPVARWNIGESTLNYGESHTAVVEATQAIEPELKVEREATPVDEKIVSSGGSAGVCNEIIMTQGSGISGGAVAYQCSDAKDVNGEICYSLIDDYESGLKTCLVGTCDIVGYPDSGGYGGATTGFGAGHNVLETLSATYIGKSSAGKPVWTSRRLCTSSVTEGDNSIDIKPESSLAYTTKWDGGDNLCYAQGQTVWNFGYAKGRLAVGKVGNTRYSTILGFNITPLAELLAPNGSEDAAKIKVTKAILSLGHTRYTTDSIDEDNDTNSVYADRKVYGDGVKVYAAKGGAYGNHPWQESGAVVHKDCEVISAIATNSINSGNEITKLLEPSAGTNRTSGGVVEAGTALDELFDIDNWFLSVHKGNDYIVNESGVVTLTGNEWAQDNVYIQFGLSHDLAVSWGLARETPALANHLNLAKYPDSDYYEQVSPNLHVEWCWTTADKKDLPGGCDYTEPSGPTLKVNISGTGSSVAVQKDGSTVATCAIADSPCSYTGVDYAATTDITLLATLGDNETFGNWVGCEQDQSEPNRCTLTLVNGTNNVFATFVGIPHDLTATLSGLDDVSEPVRVWATIGDGDSSVDAVSGLTGDQGVPAGAEVSLVAEVPDGKEVEGWAGQPDGATDCTAGETACSFIMPAANTNIIVTYKDTLTNPTVTLTSAGDGGSATLVTTQPMEIGTKAQVSFTIDDGYEVDTSGGTCPEGSTVGSTYTTGDITVDCSIKFVFKEGCKAVTTTCSEIFGFDPNTSKDPVYFPKQDIAECKYSFKEWSGSAGWHQYKSCSNSNVIESCEFTHGSSSNNITDDGKYTYQKDGVYYKSEDSCINAQ